MISKATIDEIFDKMSVVDVVQDFVSLKKRGVNYIGLCPFHNEKTPSFTVSPSKNIYKCFGCGRGGNGIDFLMEHEAFSYPEALKFVARMYSIPVEETYSSSEHIQESRHRDALQIVNDYALRYFGEALWNTDHGKSIGLGYLKERGFLEKTIRTFDIGFAPSGTSEQLSKAALAAGYEKQYLRELGFTTEKGYDFFSGRIIFPIHNLSGKPIAFAGRTMSKQSRGPKYLNSPENELYHKRKALYGLHLARRSIRSENRCFLVEGYADVMMLHQNGVENVVATSGTALTPEQIRMIRRYTENIVLIFDSDEAGTKASLRAVDLILEEGINVHILPMPQGDDPDSFIRRKGHNGFLEHIENNLLDFLNYKISLSDPADARDPVAQANLIKSIVSSVVLIEDGLKRHFYLRETSRLMEVPEETLIEELNIQLDALIKKKQVERLREVRTERRESSPQQTYPESRTSPDGSQSTESVQLQEKDIIRVLMQHGQKLLEEDLTVAEFVIDNITDVIDLFQNENYRKILSHFVKAYNEDRPLDFEYFNRSEDAEMRKSAIDAYTNKYEAEYSKNWIDMWDMDLQTQPAPEKNHKKDVRQSLMRFKLRKAVEMCEQNRSKIKELQSSGKDEEVLKHLAVQQKLLAIRNEIAREFKTIILK